MTMCNKRNEHYISVAMCSYNGEKYIEEQIQSIVNQTVVPNEIVVCDDGSTDLTINILESLRKKYKDVEILIYRNKENLGYSRNFLQAIRKCRGDIIFLSDQDDVWLETKIAEMIKVFDDNSDALAVNCAYCLINGQSELVKNKFAVAQKSTGCVKSISWKEFIRSTRFPGMSMAIRNSLVTKLVDLPIELIPAHDWLLNEAASYNHGMFYIEKILTKYRQHDANCVGAIKSDTKENLLKSRIHTLEFFEKTHKAILKIHEDPEIQDWGKMLLNLDTERRENVDKRQTLQCMTTYIKNRNNMTMRCFLGDLYTILRNK